MCEGGDGSVGVCGDGGGSGCTCVRVGGGGGGGICVLRSMCTCTLHYLFLLPVSPKGEYVYKVVDYSSRYVPCINLSLSSCVHVHGL